MRAVFVLTATRSNFGADYYSATPSPLHVRKKLEIDTLGLINCQIAAAAQSAPPSATSAIRIKRAARGGPCHFGCSTSSSVTNGREKWHDTPQWRIDFSPHSSFCGACYKSMLDQRRKDLAVERRAQARILKESARTSQAVAQPEELGPSVKRRRVSHR